MQYLAYFNHYQSTSQNLPLVRLEEVELPHQSSSSRLAVENEKLSEANRLFFEDDKIEDINTLTNKLEKTTLPSDYVTVKKENVILFLYIPVPTIEAHSQPKIVSSVAVENTMKVTAYIGSEQVEKRELSHILTNSRLENMTQLSNVLAHCKSLPHVQRQEQQTSDVCKKLDIAIAPLKALLISESGTETLNEGLIQFIIEQLELCKVKPHARRYSANLISTSFIWQITSTSLYRKLQNIFILPSMSSLRELSRSLNVECCDIDMEYLRNHSSNLTKREKIVTLLIDEVYTA